MIKNLCIVLIPSEKALFNLEEPSIPPISLGVLSGYLKRKDIETYMFDLNYMDNKNQDNVDIDKNIELFKCIYDKDRVLNYIKGKVDKDIEKIARYLLNGIDLSKYDSFGSSIGADFSLMQIHLGFIIAAYLKRKTEKPIFIGGNNISYLYIFKEFYKELWKGVLEEFSYIIKGPGEKTIFNIINSLNKGEEKETLINLKGLLRLNNDEILDNGENTPCIIRPDWENLNMKNYERVLPKSNKEGCTQIYKWPDWVSSLAYRHNKEKNSNIERKVVLPYIFNYNCPYNCAFCTQSDYDRGKVVGGRVKDIVDDIQYLKSKYNTNYFYFLNNTFNFSGTFIEEFCNEVKDRNLEIYWSDCARVNGMTYERLKLMKEAGCEKLVFGFESGSKKILDLVDKRLDLEKLKEVLEWCKDIGIWAELEVIIGLPHEFHEDFKDTYNFIKENIEKINNFWLNEYFLVPNSLIGKYPEKYNIEIRKDLVDYKGLLEWNKDRFKNKNSEFTHNARIYGFDEIEGRDYEEIKRENKKKLKELSLIQNKEFTLVRDFYNKLNNLKQGFK